MRSILVVVAHVFGDQPLQMPLVQYDHVIQQIATATSYPTLRNAVLPWATKRRSHWPNSRISHERYHVIAKLGVAVEQQKPVGRGVRPRFPHLLHDPKCAGVSGDVATENLAPLVPDDEKTVQHTKGERRECEEIHGSDGVAVISQECQPTLGGIWSSRGLSQPSRDRRFREDEAQLEQLAVNAWRSPGWILSRHAEDEGPNLLAHTLSASHTSGSGEPPPVQPEAGPMPAHNRSGGDQDEGLLPSGPHPPQHHPEQLMYGSQSTARSLDVQSQQLLTQSEVFEDKALSREESRANPIRRYAGAVRSWQEFYRNTSNQARRHVVDSTIAF